MSTYVVDCFIEPPDLKMPCEDFIARIAEPMVACLLRGFDNDGAERIHFRMWMAPITELQWSLVDTFSEGEVEE